MRHPQLEDPRLIGHRVRVRIRFHTGQSYSAIFAGPKEADRGLDIIIGELRKDLPRARMEVSISKVDDE